MTTNYSKGAAFERQIANKLRSRGLYVMRSSGSHGIFDLISIDFKHGSIKLIQVKNYKLSKKEYQEIVDRINGLFPQPTYDVHFYTLEHTGRGTDRMTCVR